MMLINGLQKTQQDLGILTRKGCYDMANIELIESVRYPDEIPMTFDSRLSYEEVVEGQKFLLSKASGQSKTDIQDTIDELQRRWKERQSISSIHVIDTSVKLNRLQA